VKWGKEKFTLDVDPSEPPETLRAQLFGLTSVRTPAIAIAIAIVCENCILSTSEHITGTENVLLCLPPLDSSITPGMPFLTSVPLLPFVRLVSCHILGTAILGVQVGAGIDLISQ
jgi:hypothetical protein